MIGWFRPRCKQRHVETPWSPDGTRFLFVGVTGSGERNLFTARRDGTDVGQIAHMHGISYVSPEWGTTQAERQLVGRRVLVPSESEPTEHGASSARRTPGRPSSAPGFGERAPSFSNPCDARPRQSRFALERANRGLPWNGRSPASTGSASDHRGEQVLRIGTA